MTTLKVICKQSDDWIYARYGMVEGKIFTENMEPIIYASKLGECTQLSVMSSTYEWVKKDIKSSFLVRSVLEKLYPEGYQFEFEYQTI